MHAHLEEFNHIHCYKSSELSRIDGEKVGHTMPTFSVSGVIIHMKYNTFITEMDQPKKDR